MGVSLRRASPTMAKQTAHQIHTNFTKDASVNVMKMTKGLLFECSFSTKVELKVIKTIQLG